MGEEEPRRKRPRAESAGKPRGMGAWVFMARKACTPPHPALKPNPSRSFLSGGRGDYPKGFHVPLSVTRAFIQGEDQQAEDYQRDSARLRNPNPAPAAEMKFHSSGSSQSVP